MKKLICLAAIAVFAAGYIVGQERAEQRFKVSGFMATHSDEKSFTTFSSTYLISIIARDEEFFKSKIKRTRPSAHGGPFFPAGKNGQFEKNKDGTYKVKEDLWELRLDFMKPENGGRSVNYLMLSGLRDLKTGQDYSFQQVLENPQN